MYESEHPVKEAPFLEGLRAKSTLCRHPLRPGAVLPGVKGKDHFPDLMRTQESEVSGTTMDAEFSISISQKNRLKLC